MDIKYLCTKACIYSLHQNRDDENYQEHFCWVYEWFSCCFPAADCTGVAELCLHQTRPQDDLSPGRGGPPQRVEEIPAPVRRQRRGRRRPQVTSCLFDLLICRFIECLFLVDWLIDWLIDWLFVYWLLDWLINWFIYWFTDWLIGLLIDLLVNWLVC